AARRAGDHHHRLPAGRARGEGSPEVVERPALEGIGRIAADLVLPHLEARLREAQGHLALAGRPGQHVEEALGVDRARGAADRHHQLHRATTSEATPEGNSSWPLTSEKPTLRNSSSYSGRLRKRPMEAGR